MKFVARFLTTILLPNSCNLTFRRIFIIVRCRVLTTCTRTERKRTIERGKKKIFIFFACEFRFAITCIVKWRKRKKKKKKERKKEEENEKHFASRICFYFQHQAAPFLYDSANNVSTDEIERLSISLKNNLCLSLPRIQILKIDRARYIYVYIYTEIPVSLDTGSQPFAFETNICVHVSKVRRQHKTNIDAAWLSTYCRYSDIL